MLLTGMLGPVVLCTNFSLLASDLWAMRPSERHLYLKAGERNHHSSFIEPAGEIKHSISEPADGQPRSRSDRPALSRQHWQNLKGLALVLRKPQHASWV